MHHALSFCLLAVRLRLSVRLDSVRHFADAARRRAGPAQHRLGQYRRHQRVAHRPQGARGGDASRRHAQGHLRGSAHALSARRRCCDRGRGRRLSRPPVSGLAALPRRQRRGDLYRRAARHRLASRRCLLRRLARGRGRDPLFVARRADCQPGGASLSVVAGRPCRRAGFFAAVDPAMDHAPRQHRTAPARHRGQDRRPAPRLERYITPAMRPAPARRGCAESCRRTIRRSCRFRRTRPAAASPRRNSSSPPDLS